MRTNEVAVGAADGTIRTLFRLRSLALPWVHRDPADRVIVATALVRDVPLLTKDDAIQRFGGVEAIW